MRVMKRVTVLGAVVIALVTSAVASGATTNVSAGSAYLNFALTRSQAIVPGTATTLAGGGFASFKLVDPEKGIARYKILASNLPQVHDGLYADLYYGQPGQNGGLVAGLRTTGRTSGVVAAGTLEWEALVSDIWAHPGNYYVQLDDVPFPGPFAAVPITPLIRGQMDDLFGLYF
jgi:CHRD domain-containing protein